MAKEMKMWLKKNDLLEESIEQLRKQYESLERRKNRVDFVVSE